MKSARKMAVAAMMLLFTGVSAAVYAQVPQPQPQSPTRNPMPNQNPTPVPSPRTEPSQMPADQHQNPAFDQSKSQNPALNPVQQPADKKVSDKELKEFAAVFPRVKDENQKAQQQMAAVIEKDGMKLERFNEIQTAKLQHQKTDADKDEMKTFKKIKKELDAMQPGIQKKMESLITSGGLSVERFQAIAIAIQNDPGLQSRFQKIMNGGGLDS